MLLRIRAEPDKARTLLRDKIAPRPYLPTSKVTEFFKLHLGLQVSLGQAFILGDGCPDHEVKLPLTAWGLTSSEVCYFDPLVTLDSSGRNARLMFCLACVLLRGFSSHHA